MSLEEDWLVRRVREHTEILRSAGMLTECEKCTTQFAADLDACPHCGHEVGEKVDPAMATAVRSDATKSGQPDALLPPHGSGPTLVGQTAANVTTEQDREQNLGSAVVGVGDNMATHGGIPDDTGESADPDAPQETIDGEPAEYQPSNVETLRAELNRRNVFVPSSGSRKNDLVRLLREDDRKRADVDAQHGS
jgi:hypothetical protein